MLTIDGEDLYRCPVFLVTKETTELLEAFSMLERNILPVNGGWLDQSALYVEAMRCISKEVAEYRKKNPPKV